MAIKLINHKEEHRKRLSELGEVGLAYLAGFFDADGCVAINRIKHSGYARGVGYTLAINVSQKWPAILNEFNKVWGGRIARYSEFFIWQAGGDDALACLADLLPYLRLKRGEAELAIEFQGGKGRRNRLTDEQFNLQRNHYAKMKELKQNRR